MLIGSNSAQGEKNRQQDEMLLLDGSRLVPLSAVVIEVAFIITAHPSLAKLSNQVFLHHIKYDPLKLLAEDREFDEIMVEALSRSPTTLPEDERT